MVEDGDDGGAYFSHYYSYTFKIADGKELISHSKCEGRLPEELTDLRKPSPIEVIYLQSNPEVNKIKNTIPESISELLWIKVGLGMVLLIAFSSIGYVLIRNAIKEYSSATKNKSRYNPHKVPFLEAFELVVDYCRRSSVTSK